MPLRPLVGSAVAAGGAIDLGTSGKDNQTGAGQLRLPELRDTVGEMRLAGDSGVLSIREQVKMNGKVVATVRTNVAARSAGDRKGSGPSPAPSAATGRAGDVLVAAPGRLYGAISV